jgi:hypothetical protein
MRLRLRNRTNSDIDTDMHEYSNIDLIYHHPALVPMIPEYFPVHEWVGVGAGELHSNINILPDIAIIGLPRAGTSQLFHILTHHPDATPFHANGAGEEECCMRLEARLLKNGWWTKSKAVSKDSRRENSKRVSTSGTRCYTNNIENAIARIMLARTSI